MNLRVDINKDISRLVISRADITEKVGILILCNNMVSKNYYSKIAVEECEGLVLSDIYAPFIFVNIADNKSAQRGILDTSILKKLVLENILFFIPRSSML